MSEHARTEQSDMGGLEVDVRYGDEACAHRAMNTRPEQSDSLTGTVLRNGALCLIALDACLWDEMTPERAIEYARGIEKAMNEEPYWADGKHAGDCTKQAMTCARCFIERAEREAQRRFEED